MSQAEPKTAPKGNRLLRRLRLPLLWLGFFALYASTVARGLLPADSGEFQLAAARWGILHPPGYPLYTVIGGLWVHLLPWGTAMWRLNLLSAALAATTLLFLVEAVRRWSDEETAGWLGGLLAATVLATAPTFWAQATTANIRMPTMLFAAWGFWALAGMTAAAPSSQGLALAVALGLGLGHHPSLLFIASGWALHLLLSRPDLLRRPRRMAALIAVTLLSWGLPQLYLPLRGRMHDVPLAVPDLDTWHGFWHHVLARGFAGDMFAFANAADLALRLPLLPTLFHVQFPWAVLLGAALAWLWLLRRRSKLAAALGLSLLVHTFVTITYRAPQTVEYLMPAYLPIVIALGTGGAQALQAGNRLPRRFRRGAAAVSLLTLLLLAARGAAMWRDFRLQADDGALRRRLEPLLRDAPPGATVLADWRWATPLWVLQQVEGLRPDVAVAYVYPVRGRDYEAIWQERAQAVEGALFTTHRFDWADWTFVPWGGGYRLYRRPLVIWEPPPDFRPLSGTTGPLAPLAWRPSEPLRPGSTTVVDLAWRRMAPAARPPSWTVRLLAADGTLLAHGDRFVGDEGAVGEVRLSTMALPLPPDYCGTATVHLAAYTTAESGFETLGELPLGTLTIPCEPFDLPPARMRPNLLLDGGPLVRGLDYETTAGRLYLHLCGPGRTLIVESGGATRIVPAAAPGRCRTVVLPWQGEAPHLRRADGRAAHLLLPLPSPAADEHYLPFGDAMVLTGLSVGRRGDQPVVDLHWLSARPQSLDLAVSVRLYDAEGERLGVHDMQPALADLPTLKWVVRGLRILDPHPFPHVALPPEGTLTVAVYERFRLTPALPPVERPRLPWRHR